MQTYISYNRREQIQYTKNAMAGAKPVMAFLRKDRCVTKAYCLCGIIRIIRIVGVICIII